MKTPPSTKAGILTLFVAAYVILYVWPNFFPAHAPALLPLTFVDVQTPFLPWTFLIYVSDYVLGAVALVYSQGPAFFSFARMAFFTLAVSGGFYHFFPTTYPRPEYPEVANPLVGLFMYLVQNGDMPNNAFPSMHVAITIVCIRAIWDVWPRAKPWLALWGVAISLSTLTTKQHYGWDVLGGVAAFAAALSIELWFQRKYSQNGVSLRG